MRLREDYDKWTFLLLAILVALKLAERFHLLSSHALLLPVIWLAVALIIHMRIPRIHGYGKIRFKSAIIGYAFTGGLFYFVAQILIGVFMQTIGASPYDLSPYGVFFNIAQLVPMIIAREQIRSYAIATFMRKHRKIAPIFISILTLVIALLEVNWNQISTFAGLEDWFIFVVSDCLPQVIVSSLLTVLSLYGGAAAASIYDILVRLIVRVFPFLPSLPWIAESALGIGFPIVLLFFVVERYNLMNGALTRRTEKNPILSSIPLMTAILFFWFTVGVFPVYPSVVLTGSMEPLIHPGDAILINKITEEEQIYALTEGDIINFQRDEINITHRIIEVLTDEAGNVSFRTKGDNNNSDDSRIVLPNEIHGTVDTVVPYVGLPNLWLRSAQPSPEGVED